MRPLRGRCAQILLAFACALGGCTSLPDVARDACGNGVVEPSLGEDCDGTGGTAGTCAAAGANACHFVCDQAACPTGMVCGGDARCRAPSAAFESAPGPYLLDGNALATGDVDGDHIDDLIAVSATALSVRHGTADGDLFALDSQAVRAPVARPDFNDLDGDGSTDVVMPSSVGLFSFLARSGVYNPYPYTSITVETGVTIRFDAVEAVPDVDSEILGVAGPRMSFINAADSATRCLDGGGAICGPNARTVDDLVGDDLPAAALGNLFGARAALDDDFTQEVAIAFTGDTQLMIVTPIFAMAGDVPDETTLSLLKVQDVVLPSTGPLDSQKHHLARHRGVFFGDLDGDGCPDLLVGTVRSTAVANFEGIAIAYGQRDLAGCVGKLESPATLALEAELPTGESTAGFLPMAVADLDGDGVADVVTSRNILATSCVRGRADCPTGIAFEFRGVTPRDWTAAVVTDVNHDGVPDLAGASDAATGIDVLLGGGFALFNRFQVDTALPVRALRTGDFDGDRFLDVAAVVGDATAGDSENDELVVSFGAASGGPSAVVSMGHFGILQGLATVSLIADVTTIDVISDLLVIADRDGSRGVAPLLGSSARRLLAPYTLQVQDIPTTPAVDESEDDTPVAVVTGDFDGTGGRDVVALASPARQNGSAKDPVAVDTRLRVFGLTGAGDGNLIAAGPPMIADASLGFAYASAVYAAGPIDAIGNDDIVGIDAAPSATGGATSHLLIVHPGQTQLLDPPVALPAAYQRVSSVQLVDVDADGDRDLLVGFARHAGHEQPVSIILVNTGGTFDVAAPIELAPDGRACGGVAALQLDGDPALELAVACTDGAVVLLDLDGATVTELGTAPALGDGRVVAGDFNGDKLADLAVPLGTGPTATVSIVTQCAAGAACGIAVEPATSAGGGQ